MKKAFLLVIMCITLILGLTGCTKEEETPTIVGNTFTKTYNVLDILPSNEKDIVYVTIRQFQEEDVQTVKINKNLCPDISKDNNYEFKFEVTNDEIEENTTSIFKNSKVISITKTDKTGLEQIQESIRKEN